jgi:hypothetical protein
MAKIGNLDIYFSENDADLYQWIEALGKVGYNKNQVGRNCLEIGRLFSGSLTEAQDARRALARLQQLYPKKWQELIKDGE